MTGTTNSPHLKSLIERRLTRRDALARAGVGLAAALRGRADAQTSAAGTRPPRIAASAADSVVVPPGYRADVVIRWGDPLSPGGAAVDVDGIAEGSLYRRGAAAAQSGAFGTNCDGIGLLATAPDRLIACVNHEYPTTATMFPGWVAARQRGGRGPFIAERPEAVGVMQAAVGVSVMELARRKGRWELAGDGKLNRRITATTPVQLSGPAAGHPWLGRSSDDGACFGTFGNCAAGMTPWGTYLTAEENIDDFFGRGGDAELDPDMAAAHRRFGLRRRDSAYRWEYVDSRFDLTSRPAEPFNFGWIVEIDPLRPDVPVRKRTALGRFKHEGATTVLAADRRAVVYMGDDEAFEYLYKFVSDGRYDPARPDPDLLDSGTLYVARLAGNGRGEWLPLVWNDHRQLTPAAGFHDQGDVVIRCREAADRVGATPLDRPEDVAVSPVTGRVYLACTQNADRGSDAAGAGRTGKVAPDAANPRTGNRYGHILELHEDDDDFAANGFRWDVFVLAGDPAGGLRVTVPMAGAVDGEVTYFAGQADATRLSAFANPDNLGFDRAGNLWIVTDGTQPLGNNNGCFVCPTTGPERGAVGQFMSGPIGAEIAGCEFSPDGSTLFLSVQHPGAGGSAERAISDWPDGDGRPPKSGLIAITPADAGRGFAG